MDKHILVIEDDRALNGGIVFALEKEGYHVHSAYTLQEAEKSLKQRMNLILLFVVNSGQITLVVIVGL